MENLHTNQTTAPIPPVQSDEPTEIERFNRAWGYIGQRLMVDFMRAHAGEMNRIWLAMQNARAPACEPRLASIARGRVFPLEDFAEALGAALVYHFENASDLDPEKAAFDPRELAGLPINFDPEES